MLFLARVSVQIKQVEGGGTGAEGRWSEGSTMCVYTQQRVTTMFQFYVICFLLHSEMRTSKSKKSAGNSCVR